MAELGLDLEVLTATQSSPLCSQQELGRSGCSAEGKFFQVRGCFVLRAPGLAWCLAHNS